MFRERQHQIVSSQLHYKMQICKTTSSHKALFQLSLEGFNLRGQALHLLGLRGDRPSLCRNQALDLCELLGDGAAWDGGVAGGRSGGGRSLDEGQQVK